MIKSKKIFLLSIFALLINNNILFAQSVKLSEIMFAPSESNSEFIEVKNTSENETIDLTGYKIKYHTVSADDIISPTNEYLLQPNQYAIIFEADYDFGNGVYQNILDANALIFILDDNAFGSTGMANTSDREIFLLNSTEDTIDSYIYSADNEIGFSDEIIDFDKKNWSNSTILNGTPGSRNSVSPKQNDLRISEIKFSSSNIVIGEPAAIKITIENLGVLLADQFIFNLYNDVNKDKIQLEDELIFTKVLENLLPNDFVIIEDTIRNIELGENNIIAEVILIKMNF
ncbi:MAG: lamin tail domain-containing protein [Ignavibacteriales bacterium]|nr:lamin tail domain-containing protein [Ignavibacteriales bacterium]